MSSTPKVQISLLVFKQATPRTDLFQVMALAGGKGWAAQPEAGQQYAAWTGSCKLPYKHSLNRDGIDNFLDNLSSNYRSCTEQQ